MTPLPLPKDFASSTTSTPESSPLWQQVSKIYKWTPSTHINTNNLHTESIKIRLHSMIKRIGTWVTITLDRTNQDKNPCKARRLEEAATKLSNLASMTLKWCPTAKAAHVQLAALPTDIMFLKDFIKIPRRRQPTTA